MKKIALVLTFIILLFGISFAGDNSMGWNGPIAITLTAGQAATEVGRFELASFKPNGFLSWQQVITASGGTVTTTYQITNYPTEPIPDAMWMSTGITALATDQASGTNIWLEPTAGEPQFAKWIRIMCAETGGLTPTTVTIYPNVQ